MADTFCFRFYGVKFGDLKIPPKAKEKGANAQVKGKELVLFLLVYARFLVLHL